jgi:nitroreductase
MTTDEALDLALEALEEIALAGMSGTGQEGNEAMTNWHARQAWKFIGIAARALEPIKQARALDKKAENARELGLDYEPVQERNFCERCGKRLGDYIHTCTPPAAPVQKPVAWVEYETGNHTCTPPHNVEAKTT